MSTIGDSFMFIVRGNEVEVVHGPIEREMINFEKNLREAKGKGLSYCYRCKEKGWGIGDLMTGEFLCDKCIMRDKYDRLINDPEWIKRERVWKLRQAICNRKTKEDMEKMIVRDDKAI
jgi:hypothetical protein